MIHAKKVRRKQLKRRYSDMYDEPIYRHVLEDINHALEHDQSYVYSALDGYPLYKVYRMREMLEDFGYEVNNSEGTEFHISW
jgi:hypothetical protein